MLTGEKLEFAHEFLQFMQAGAVDAIHPDIAFTHGITGMRKIADLLYISHADYVAAKQRAREKS